MTSKTKRRVKKPRALLPGDAIELVAPAGPFSRSAMTDGARIVRQMGFEPIWDEGVFTKTGFFAGTDEQRARRLEKAILNQETKALWSIRGGYGTTRVMGLLDKKLLMACDKLLIGFSDLTGLLLNMSLTYGLVSIHGPVITQLPRIPRTHVRWLKRLMTYTHPISNVPLGRSRTLRDGSASGVLAGGNLSILSSLVGTGFLPSLEGCILFLEDVAEPAYSLDRMWRQLLLSGALDGVRAVILGELTKCMPSGNGEWSARKVLERAIEDLGVPAISGAAFGHGKANIALPVGIRASLDTGDRSLALLDKSVR